MTEIEKKMMKLMIMIAGQNEKLSKRIKGLEDNIEIISESVDTLIQIQMNKLK